MDGPIFGSEGQQIGFRQGMEVFDLNGTKRFDVDLAGNLLNPLNRIVEGHLQPADVSLPNERSLDHLFEELQAKLI